MKSRYEKKLLEEGMKNKNDIEDVNKLEEIEKDLLSRLKHTQVKE